MGIGLGIGGNQLRQGREVPESSEELGRASQQDGSKVSHPNATAGTHERLANEHRAYDSVQEFLADTEPGRVGRRAMWLLSADAMELAAIFEHLKSNRRAISWVMVDVLLRRWTALDPEAALAAAEGTEWVRKVWKWWGMNDPDAMLKADAAPPDAVELLLNGIALEDPDYAFKLIEENPSHGSVNVLLAIQTGLRRIDPERALLFSRNWVGAEDGPAIDWARKDAAAVISWYAKNANGREPSYQYRKLVKEIATSDPEEARRLAESLPPGAYRRDLMLAYGETVAAKNPGEALAIAREESSPRIKRGLLTQVGRELAKTDPESSLELLRELVDDVGLIYRRPLRHGSSASGADKPAPGTDE